MKGCIHFALVVGLTAWGLYPLNATALPGQPVSPNEAAHITRAECFDTGGPTNGCCYYHILWGNGFETGKFQIQREGGSQKMEPMPCTCADFFLEWIDSSCSGSGS